MEESRARRLAERFYGDRKDRAGLPEIDHSRRVAERVSARARSVAWLHDVVEDGLVDWDELIEEGLTVIERLAIFFLTRRPEVTYREYILSLRRARGLSGEIAREVKLADIEDNTTRPCPPESLDMRRPEGRYAKAKDVLLDA